MLEVKDKWVGDGEWGMVAGEEGAVKERKRLLAFKAQGGVPWKSRVRVEGKWLMTRPDQGEVGSVMRRESVFLPASQLSEEVSEWMLEESRKLLMVEKGTQGKDAGVTIRKPSWPSSSHGPGGGGTARRTRQRVRLADRPVIPRSHGPEEEEGEVGSDKGEENGGAEAVERLGVRAGWDEEEEKVEDEEAEAVVEERRDESEDREVCEEMRRRSSDMTAAKADSRTTRRSSIADDEDEAADDEADIRKSSVRANDWK
jgi:hypothetical protein